MCGSGGAPSFYIIHFLELNSSNLGKSIVKTPKLYLIDSGLMCYLLRVDTKEELLLDDHKGAAGQVYYLGDLTCEVDGVKYVSWRDWGA